LRRRRLRGPHGREGARRVEARRRLIRRRFWCPHRRGDRSRDRRGGDARNGDRRRRSRRHGWCCGDGGHDRRRQRRGGHDPGRHRQRRSRHRGRRNGKRGQARARRRRRSESQRRGQPRRSCQSSDQNASGPKPHASRTATRPIRLRPPAPNRGSAGRRQLWDNGEGGRLHMRHAPWRLRMDYRS
jgi:hypothetical protein